MEKQLNTIHNVASAGAAPKSNRGCCMAALILSLLITCISFAGCADARATTTAPTTESIAAETAGHATQAQSLDEMEAVAEPVTEKTTIPTETESTSTETIHTHSYTSKITKPSCTVGGYTTFICGCGDTYIENQTDAVGHSYNEKVTAPSCAEKGYTTYTCSVCGDSYTGNKTSATGHSWDSWKVTKEPTSASEGTEERICTICGREESRNTEKLPSYETFNGTIGSYNAHNLPYIDWKGDTEQAAYIEIYTVEKNEEVLNELAAKFEQVYGFAPSLGDKYDCTSSCEKIGTYMVDGYADPQTVYRYSITDKTYIYITNPMYEVYVQQCDDGSVWVGYCIYATMNTIDEERSKAKVQALDQQMYAKFESLIGLRLEEMSSYKDELNLLINYVSAAGTVRSAHSDKPVQVLYIYCRGFSYNDG